MCWDNEDEPYNGGSAFKITCRDQRGIMVTILADNYFGYCKKEVKTQISFAANLYGLCEEEHAGGAIVGGWGDGQDDSGWSAGGGGWFFSQGKHAERAVRSWALSGGGVAGGARPAAGAARGPARGAGGWVGAELRGPLRATPDSRRSPTSP